VGVGGRFSFCADSGLWTFRRPVYVRPPTIELSEKYFGYYGNLKFFVGGLPFTKDTFC